MSTNPYWDNITRIAQKQRDKGIGKYNMGLEDNREEVVKRIQYIQEELIDGLMYLEWLKEGLHGERK